MTAPREELTPAERADLLNRFQTGIGSKPVSHPCCRHCPDDPEYHAENPPNSHETSCPTCDRYERERLLSLIESREWAESFLSEWVKPYFGEDADDAIACVQRAAKGALAQVVTGSPS